MKIKWRQKPEAHDYPAAQSYLALLVDDRTAKRLANELKDAPMSAFKAKDLRRASSLELLSESNRHVKRNLKKIEKGVDLSPVLLVRGSRLAMDRLVIADGFHRISAAHVYDEDAEVPCKIV